MTDIMPWLVNMRKLDRYNIKDTYDRWAEEVQALLSISGVSKAIIEKGTQGDELARGIIILSLERDLRETMAGKVNISTACDLWNGVKKAKKVLVSPLYIFFSLTRILLCFPIRPEVAEIDTSSSMLVVHKVTDITFHVTWITGGRRESLQR